MNHSRRVHFGTSEIFYISPTSTLESIAHEDSLPHSFPSELSSSSYSTTTPCLTLSQPLCSPSSSSSANHTTAPFPPPIMPFAHSSFDSDSQQQLNAVCHAPPAGTLSTGSSPETATSRIVDGSSPTSPVLQNSAPNSPLHSNNSASNKGKEEEIVCGHVENVKKRCRYDLCYDPEERSPSPIFRVVL
eukprot:PhF_6_TR35767/c0_g1_i1/m.51968